MKSKNIFKGNIVAIVLIVFIMWIGVPFWRFINGPIWYKDFEGNAKNVITASQLQMWATNLIAMYPSNVFLSPKELGTNYPTQLLSLAPRGYAPGAMICIPPDTNMPAFVAITWGAGQYGSRGIEIGQTNFTGFQPKRHEWQPGVYFFKRF